jgi:hypothetical protein
MTDRIRTPEEIEAINEEFDGEPTNPADAQATKKQKTSGGGRSSSFHWVESLASFRTRKMITQFSQMHKSVQEKASIEKYPEAVNDLVRDGTWKTASGFPTPEGSIQERSKKKSAILDNGAQMRSACMNAIQGEFYHQNPGGKLASGIQPEEALMKLKAGFYFEQLTPLQQSGWGCAPRNPSPLSLQRPVNFVLFRMMSKSDRGTRNFVLNSKRLTSDAQNVSKHAK